MNVEREVNQRLILVRDKMGQDEVTGTGPPERDTLDYFINDMLRMKLRLQCLQERNDLMAGTIGLRVTRRPHRHLKMALSDLSDCLDKRIPEMIRIRAELMQYLGALGEVERAS